MLKLLSTLFFAGILAATSAAAQSPAASQIHIEPGWARATAGQSTNGAAYVTIESPSDDRLIAATSPVAADVQLHLHSMADGVMQMRQVDGFDVHAGRKLVLKPNGPSLMLIGLKQKLVAGDSFPITLTFEKAGTVEAQIMVRKLGSSDKGDGEHDMNNMPGMPMSGE